jgi:hypothetical protein
MKYVLFLLILHASVAKGQTAQQIIARHIEAIGGKAKTDAVNSFQYESRSSQIYYKKPDRWRSEYIVDNKVEQFSVYAGIKSWTVSDDGKVNPSFALSVIEDKFTYYLPGYILIATQLGCKVKYEGIDIREKAFMIRLTPQENNILECAFIYYIDSSTYLVKKVLQSISGKAWYYYYSDYTIIGGIKIPGTIIREDTDTNKRDTTLRTNIRLNVALDDRLFQKPVSSQPAAMPTPFKGKNGKWGYQDEDFNVIVKPVYDNVWGLSDNGLGKVELNNLFGYVSLKGGILVPPKYESADNFEEGMAGVMLKDKWGFINSKGKQVGLLEYEKVRDFGSGLAAVKLNNKWGFVDKEMKLVIPLMYDDVGKHYSGLAVVTIDKKYGYVDTKGTVIIPLEYDFAMYFEDGKCRVKKDNVFFSLDKTGKKIETK